MSSFSSWSEAGIDTKGRTTGSIKVKCPQCPPDRGNPRDTSLSVNLDLKVWNCHYCKFAGVIKNTLYGREKKPKRIYQKPSFIPAAPTETMVRWFKEKRGITLETLARFGISPIEKFTPLTGKKELHVAFPYKKNGEVVNVKSRFECRQQSGEKQKSFTLEKDCELPFYNIDAIQEQSVCVITEGEVDAITVFQEMDLPAISVPTGASKEDQKQKLECLDIDWEKFSEITTFVLATDNDSPGIALRIELARRLGKENCYYVEYPADCKDINEVLVKHGSAAVRQVFANYKPFPIEGIITVADMESEIDNLYENGYPKGESIGFPVFDTLLTFRPGEVTTITGIPGHGKSEFLDEILLKLTQKGWSHGIYSAETPPTIHFVKLAERYVGKKFYHPDAKQKMSLDEAKQAKDCINQHFYFINEQEVETSVDGLLAKAKELVQRKGIKSFVIDPYNCIDHRRPINMSETEYVSLVYSKLVKFALHHDVHVFLVAHPAKQSKDPQTGKYEVPTMYSISGSANFFNKTHNGLCVYRHMDQNLVVVYVQKVKFKFIGKLGFSAFEYDATNGRYSEKVP
ncbi:DNA primase/helicase [Adhaeribacter aerolatus]|uniref:DNA primase/helicase n=1 Tax=Adhaeribacter aerolatus TaxID=670289 RepID=A0A512AUI0_9BACT|nr:toprim domain-containing protein [Adhaeribacter aerolatus]GEO03368.1 DNA primase/helicase [Adhaeribacter aerolatus]